MTHDTDLDQVIDRVHERIDQDPDYARGVEDALSTLDHLLAVGCTRDEALQALEAMREQARDAATDYTFDEAVALVGATVRARERIETVPEPIEPGELGYVTRLFTQTGETWTIFVEWRSPLAPAQGYAKHDVDTGRLEIVKTGPTPRVCRRCGCTFSHGCPGGCAWTTGDICSACVEPQEASA